MYAPGKNEEPLFHKADIRDVLSAQTRVAIQEVQKQDDQYILKVIAEDFADYLFDKFKIDLPEIGDPVMEELPAKLDLLGDPRYPFANMARNSIVDASEIRITLPFTGDAELFRVRPVTFSLSLPRAHIKKNELEFSFINRSFEQQPLKKAIDERITSIKGALADQKPTVDDFNSNLRSILLSAINKRREAILKRKELAGLIGIPMKSRSDVASTYTVPTVRKKLPVQKPQVSSAPFQPDPTLALEHYENIVSLLCSVARGMEYSPELFKGKGEEDLRTLFLIQLHAQYESVGGETFNGSGKTDILIRHEAGNLFIAECKIWRGAKEFNAAIDQLLGYVTWRDTKTALLIFCMNKDCTAVQKQLETLVQSHPNYKRNVEFKSEMGWRFAMKNRNDSGKEFFLTVLFFCLPCED